MYVFVCGVWEGMLGEGHLLCCLCHVRVDKHTHTLYILNLPITEDVMYFYIFN